MRAILFISLLSISVTAAAGSQLTVRQEGIGCSDRESYNELVKFAVSGDKEAFGQLLAVGLLTGICVKSTPGEIVYLEDTAIFSGQMNIRKKGELTSCWTAIETAK